MSDSDTPTFFAFVGVDLEARWELNKGVCRTRDGTNNKNNKKTKLLSGVGYVGIQSWADLTPPSLHVRCLGPELTRTMRVNPFSLRLDLKRRREDYS